MSHHSFVLLIAALVATACSDGGREIVVRMTVPGPDSAPAPVPEAQVLALAYDRDSLREALAEAAPVARPRAAEAALDSIFAAFREPFNAFVTASAAVARLTDSLDALGTRGAAAAERQALEQRLAAAEADQRAARTRLDAARTAAGDRGDSLRRVIQQWEHSAFQNWGAEVEQLSRGAREPRADTTGPRGMATLMIPGGSWWIHATAHDPLDPNARWYWNVPVPADGDTVVLDARSGVRRARY